jgi:hypothetical protein
LGNWAEVKTKGVREFNIIRAATREFFKVAGAREKIYAEIRMAESVRFGERLQDKFEGSKFELTEGNEEYKGE